MSSTPTEIAYEARRERLRFVGGGTWESHDERGMIRSSSRNEVRRHSSATAIVIEVSVWQSLGNAGYHGEAIVFLDGPRELSIQFEHESVALTGISVQHWRCMYLPSTVIGVSRVGLKR